MTLPTCYDAYGSGVFLHYVHRNIKPRCKGFQRAVLPYLCAENNVYVFCAVRLCHRLRAWGKVNVSNKDPERNRKERHGARHKYLQKEVYLAQTIAEKPTEQKGENHPKYHGERHNQREQSLGRNEEL